MLIAKNKFIIEGWWWRRKKAKGTKKCIIKYKLKFEDYKMCLRASQIENVSDYLKGQNYDDEEPKQIHKQFF